MSAAERFLDTNVLLYLLSGDDSKADRAEGELNAGDKIAVGFATAKVDQQGSLPAGMGGRGPGGGGGRRP